MKMVDAIARIEAGGFVMAEYDEASGALKYRCVPGGGLTQKQADRIIQKLGLKPGNDALLPDVPSQTWRL